MNRACPLENGPMRKLALTAIAAAFAATGAVSTASAALSDREGTVWHAKSEMQVAGRNGNKGDRGDRGGKDRGGRHDKKGKVIWRVRDKHNRPFFLFRGRGDCRTETVKVRDGADNLVLRQAWVCN
jgi:hypothetical protein